MSRIRPVLLLNGQRAGEWWTVDGTYFFVPRPIELSIHEVTRSNEVRGPYEIPLPPADDTYRALKLTLFNRVLWVGVLSGTREDELPQLAIKALFKPDVVDKLRRSV